jgi:hypothetical protein
MEIFTNDRVRIKPRADACASKDAHADACESNKAQANACVSNDAHPDACVSIIFNHQIIKSLNQ